MFRYNIKKDMSVVSIDTRNYDISMGTGRVTFGAGGGLRGNVFVNGNVGIGITNPTCTLDVCGAVQISGGTAWLKSTGTNNLYIGGSANFLIQQDAANNKLFITRNSNYDMTILGTNGNVGINTILPSQLLDVNGTCKINSLLIPSTNVIEFGSGVAGKDGNAGKIGYTVFSTGLDIVGAGTTSVSRLVRIYDILSVSLSVGIGTTNPTETLEVYKTTTTNNQVNITSIPSSGASTTNTSTLNLKIRGAGGGDVNNTIFSAYSTLGGGDYRIAICPSTNEVLNVFGGGKVGIGTTGPTQSLGVQNGIRLNQANNTYNKLLVLWDGNINDANDSGTNFYGFGINTNTLRYQVVDTTSTHKFYGGASLYGTVNNLGFVNPSDIKLKKNIVPLNYGLPEILKLNPVKYLFKHQKDDDKLNTGLIAQEVKEILPELIFDNIEPDGTNLLTLSYTGIVPVLIKAMQEQQQQIEQLQQRIQALENK